MANDPVKIVDLPADTSVGGSEAFPVTDAGTTKKVTVNQVAAHAVNALMASTTSASIDGAAFIIRDSEGAAKRISTTDLVTALSSTLLTLAGTQTVTGDKTFSGGVIVPTATAESADGTAINKGYLDTALEGKVSTAIGMGLSKNDFTDALKTKLDGIATGAQVNTVTSVNTQTGAVVLAASDVGAAAQTPTFTEASSLTEPVGTGETMEALLGKLWKAIADEIAHLADTDIHITAEERTAWTAKQNAALVTTFQGVPDDTHYPSEKLVSDALAIKQNTSNLVTAFQNVPDNSHYPSEKLLNDSLLAKQNTANIRTTWQSSPDHTHYPSERLVKESLDTKQDIAIVSSWQSTVDDTHYPSEKLVHDELIQKQTFNNRITSWNSASLPNAYPAASLVKDSLDDCVKKVNSVYPDANGNVDVVSAYGMKTQEVELPHRRPNVPLTDQFVTKLTVNESWRALISDNGAVAGGYVLNNYVVEKDNANNRWVLNYNDNPIGYAAYASYPVATTDVIDWAEATGNQSVQFKVISKFGTGILAMNVVPPTSRAGGKCRDFYMYVYAPKDAVREWTASGGITVSGTVTSFNALITPSAWNLIHFIEVASGVIVASKM